MHEISTPLKPKPSHARHNPSEDLKPKKNLYPIGVYKKRDGYTRHTQALNDLIRNRNPTET